MYTALVSVRRGNNSVDRMRFLKNLAYIWTDSYLSDTKSCAHCSGEKGCENSMYHDFFDLGYWKHCISCSPPLNTCLFFLLCVLFFFGLVWFCHYFLRLKKQFKGLKNFLSSWVANLKPPPHILLLSSENKISVLFSEPASPFISVIFIPPPQQNGWSSVRFHLDGLMAHLVSFYSSGKCPQFTLIVFSQVAAIRWQWYRKYFLVEQWVYTPQSSQPVPYTSHNEQPGN